MAGEFCGYPLDIERRPYQRSIGVLVHLNGTIKVTAGKIVSERRIYNFLNECRDWIQSVQFEHQKMRNQYPPKKFVEGEQFLYLGHDLPLEFCGHKLQNLQFEIRNDALLCWRSHRRPYTQAEYRQALLKCYERSGREWLKCRVQFWSKAMQLYPKKLSFRSQKTRWGSCNSKGHVSLNWRLVAAPLPVLDYVVIHELAHLKHQNHSPAFWQLVEQFDSHHKYNRKWLREHQWEFDFLARKSELHGY